jgi:tRNA uridine 5-carbamoylmethylation protein Kti12
MKNHVNIKHVKNLNNDALRGIEFYTQELGILQERLQEIAGDNTARAIQEQVEHFQNQLLIHGNYLSGLKREIHNNDLDIEADLLLTRTMVSESVAAEHNRIHDACQNEEKIFNDLRHEFNRFAAEWL